MAGSPRATDVVLVAYSEFGRRVMANASEDFRSLYSELLTSVLGADPAPVIGTEVAASHVLV
jgi:hypothetical protein